MNLPPSLAVVVPTRNRAAYLEVALASLRAAAEAVEAAGGSKGVELVVVDDGSSDGTRAVAARAGVTVVGAGPPGGLNAARNAGIEATRAPLIAFVDDDVRVPEGWARALIEGAARNPDVEAFGGPIIAALEGFPPRACGREQPPITHLDLGPGDRPVEVVWGSNMAVRREAVQRIGRFDESIGGHGDEEDWLARLRAAGGEIVYLGAAGLEHRRSAEDARLRSLAMAAYRRGRGARRSDERRGVGPGLGHELLVLAGCVGHAVRYRCGLGVVMAAHSAGRLRGALSSAPSERPAARSAERVRRTG